MITLSLPNPALPREYRDCRARGWLLRGAPIVPLVPGGKRPLNGWDSRHPIRTLKALVRVLEEDATCNYGVLLSPESGLVGIDVDGEEGLASWRELDQGRSPKTLTVNTPRGFHLYFAHRGEVIRNSAGKLGVGIDVRGNAGYLVGPGSRSSSGELYRFAPGLCPGSVKIARLPDFLLDLLTGQGKIDNPTGGAAPRAHATVREGGRNTHLTSVAGHLQNTGISPDALLAALLAENDQNCSPPLDRAEVERIAASVARYIPKPTSGDDADQICRAVLNERFAGGAHLLYGLDGQFWSFQQTRWSPLPKAVLARMVLEAAEQVSPRSRQNTAGLMRQAVSLLEARSATRDDLLRFNSEPPPVVNCRNGEVWILPDGSFDLRPHKPESYLRQCLPVDFDPAAKCPRYEAAVAEIFSKARAPSALTRLWHELMGYAIQPNRPIPTVLIGRGEGRNGKTVLLETLVQLIGRELVVAMPVEDLDKSRFAVGSLLGKLLFLDDDVKAGVRLPDGQLKRLSENKTMTGEHKYGPQFTFTVRTLPVLLCNRPPSLRDLSFGMQRRLLVIPFDRTFDEREDDRMLFKEIWASELSGVLNLFLAGLRRVIGRGWQFDVPAEVDAAKDEWLVEANPVPAFVEARCDRDPNGYSWMAELYKAFISWATESGITQPQQQATFKRNLESLGFEVVHGHKGDKVRGLKLRPPDKAWPRHATEG